VDLDHGVVDVDQVITAHLPWPGSVVAGSMPVSFASASKNREETASS
jgi:hypothetical protein